jgi:hypothetical protein
MPIAGGGHPVDFKGHLLGEQLTLAILGNRFSTGTREGYFMRQRFGAIESYREKTEQNPALVFPTCTIISPFSGDHKPCRDFFVVSL